MIITSSFETVLGPMIAGAVEKGICLLEFNDRRMLNTELRDLRKFFNTEISEGRNPHIENLRIQLDEYFSGRRKVFDLNLVTPGTEFQKSVWQELLRIPFGTTRSYQEQANALGKAGSIRAVANANGMNRIAIIIPCHRVIGSDGSLTGYGGGLKRKRWLLDHEKKHSGLPVDLSLF